MLTDPFDFPPLFSTTRRLLTRAFRPALLFVAMIAQGSLTVALIPAALTPAVVVTFPTNVLAQCPEEPPLQNYTGGGTVTCPCFVAGEQAGVVLEAPPSHYPLEILRVGIGWGSLFGGTGNMVEEAINIYEDGLPNPGTPIFELVGPQLLDGVINEFNLEPIPGEIVINSGPFTVTLEFFNENLNNFSLPSVVHDGNGCQPGKNVIFAIPGGWNDACALAVTGDWVFFVVYRPCVTATGIGDEPLIASTTPAALMPAQPNPFSDRTDFDFFLADAAQATVLVYNVKGRLVARLTDQSYAAGTHRVTWNGLAADGTRLPSGVYFVELRSGVNQSVRKVLLTK
ncbi:MAG: T9SS type A sorting domain-containing protein [Candidatus Krumholzibacteria bacterium]|nr:T9SS type A sorting domain-containing protein [Candidatus Krumholzibacteria bacterium]